MAWDSTSFPWDWDAETFHIPGHGSGIDLRKATGNGRLLETELCVGKNGGPPHIGKELGPAMPTTGATPLVKHDTANVDWHVSRHINGVSREGGPGATALTKHVASNGDWHVSRYMNGISREGGPVPTTCPTSLSRHEESNVGWRHMNGTGGSGMANTYGVMPSNGVGGHSDVSCMATGLLPIVTTCTGLGSGPFTGFNNNSGAQSPGKVAQKEVTDNWKKTEYGIAGVFEADRQQPSTAQHTYQQTILSKEKTQLAAIQVKEERSVASTSKGAGSHHMDEQHSSNATGSAGSGDSFTVLHLGKRTYSQDVSKATASKSAQKPVLAPKKARTGVAIPRCQVEGCKLDLTLAKDYHRRHKVCEPHSKAGKVVVGSAEQRFCQQCSRFHPLAEFDEAKRSCRRRLAGHNERRRKPQPDPLALHARLHSTFEDWSFLHQPRFSRMPLLWQDPGDFRSAGMWPRTTSPFDNHPALDYSMQGPATERQSYFKSLSQPSLSYHDKLSLLLLQSPKSVMPNSVTYPRVHQYPFEGLGDPMGDSLTLAPSSTGAGVLPGLDTTPVTRGVTRVTDSGRALSLLSLQTRSSQAPDVLMPDSPGLANIVTLNHSLTHHEEPIIPQQFFIQGGQQYYHDVSVDKAMVSTALSSSQPHSGGVHSGTMVSFERDLDECSFSQDLNRQASYHPFFALMPYHQEDGLSQGGQQHESAAG